MACAAVIWPGFTGTATAESPVRAASCGTPLDAGEIATIRALSDTETVAATEPIQRLEEVADRNHRISEILVAHGDRRGLFALMDDIADRVTVLPLLRAGDGLTDPARQAEFYLGNYDSWLGALHADFTGVPVSRYWTRYFDLAAECSESAAYTAMVGYNAHMSVDIPRSLADAGVGVADRSDYFRLLDAIAVNSSLLVDTTKAAYNADVGPLWRFYFFGEGLDRVTGPGVGSKALLRGALTGINAANLANGIGLADPAARGATNGVVDAQWAAVDGVLAALTRAHGL
ncbi:hypothetical protein BJY24_001021 [Nocardia transvalensis]|uniref:Uncharacterized protein n=1 Tax=Nocardia transvalensis TaxID=37333 RepID=A0A7W9UGD4_9NOCA|nr:DUF5995 family protein [Nocardia transvalensis]MBB5912154.1 hypothetical protein [Nocardia transvalensis]